MWLDTSVLVSLYVPEPRSARVARLVRRVRSATFSQLHELEVVNALRLRLFRREARPRLVEATVAHLEDDLRDGTLHRAAIDWPLTMAKAVELASQHTARLGCRSLDVLHVAAAVLGQPAFRHGRSPSEPGRPSRGSDHDPIDVGGGAPGPRRRHRAVRGVAGEVVLAAQFSRGGDGTGTTRRREGVGRWPGNRSPISRTSLPELPGEPAGRPARPALGKR